MIATGIKDYLESQGVGTYETDLFVRVMPEKPDNAICVYDEPGNVTDEMHSYDVDSFGSQIIVRGTYAFVKAKMLEIHRKVAGLMRVTLDGIYIGATHIQTPPAAIGTDKKGRAEYSVHYVHHCNIGGNEFRT